MNNLPFPQHTIDIGKHYAVLLGCKAGGLQGDQFWLCVWQQFQAEGLRHPRCYWLETVACFSCLWARGWIVPDWWDTAFPLPRPWWHVWL